jgi:hypothetical protein
MLIYQLAGLLDRHVPNHLAGRPDPVEDVPQPPKDET